MCIRIYLLKLALGFLEFVDVEEAIDMLVFLLVGDLLTVLPALDKLSEVNLGSRASRWWLLLLW